MNILLPEYLSRDLIELLNDHNEIVEFKNKKYRKAELRQQFSKVEKPGDWKDRIVAYVRCEELDLTKAAVEFFTGTEVSTTEFRGDGWVKIEADGYRKGPAGDH